MSDKDMPVDKYVAIALMWIAKRTCLKHEPGHQTSFSKAQDKILLNDPQRKNSNRYAEIRAVLG